MTDTHEALRAVIRDLRDHTPLTDLLESPEAIDEGWPTDTQQYGVVVRVQPVTDSSSWEGGGLTTRTHRFQFSVVARQEWRERQEGPTYHMTEIMSRIADRLDIASGTPGLTPDGAASGSWEDVSNSRVALIQDWRIVSRPTR